RIRALHQKITRESHRKIDARHKPRQTVEREQTVVADHVAEIPRRAAASRVRYVRDEHVWHIDDLIAGAQKPRAESFFFAIEMQLLAVTADLVKGPPAQEVREADVGGHTAPVRDWRRLHRRRPRPAVAFRLRATDRSHFR